MNSCLEQRNEPFDACLNKFGVDLDELGLGFVREEKRERKEERERTTKMNEPGCFPLYISTWTGLIQTRSTLSYFQPFDLDPDGSGSIQRFWSVMEIRIHQVCGFGPGSVGLFCFFFSSFEFLANCTYIFATWTPVRVNFLTKIPEKLPCVSWCFFNCFVAFLHLEMDKKYVC